MDTDQQYRLACWRYWSQVSDSGLTEFRVWGCSITSQCLRAPSGHLSPTPPNPEPQLPSAVSGTPQLYLSLPSAVSPHVTFTEETHLHPLCTDSSYLHASTLAVSIAGCAPRTLSLRSIQNARFQAHWSLVHLLSEGTSPSLLCDPTQHVVVLWLYQTHPPLCSNDLYSQLISPSQP